MEAAGSYLGGGSDACHFDRRVRVFGFAVAELPGSVFSPPHYMPTREQRTRVAFVDGDVCGGRDACHFDRRSRVFGVAVAELPAFIRSPAVDMPAREHHTRVAFPRGHLVGA